MSFSRCRTMMSIIFPGHQFGILYTYLTLSPPSRRITIQTNNQTKIPPDGDHTSLPCKRINTASSCECNLVPLLALFGNDTISIFFHYQYPILLLNLITLIFIQSSRISWTSQKLLWLFLLHWPSPHISFHNQ